MLINDPYQMLRTIELEGAAEYKESIDTGGEMKRFRKTATEAELTREIILGMLDHYARAAMDVAIEGSIVTPEWCEDLDTQEFTTHAAFVGYTKDSHADAILAYAKDHPHDWIAQWLKVEHGNEKRIRAWISKQVKNSQLLKISAAEHGYPFFDVATQPFDTYLISAREYFGQF